jgi:type IV pilus assembly protein PilN
MALLAIIAVGLGIWAHTLQKRLDRASGQMNALRTQTDAAQQERLHNEARMRLPANAAVLNRAHFLNSLFLAKSFSWTAVMMDLENVLPAGVQVTSITPQVTQSGDVIIQLRVSGERDRAVQLVRNLEHSRRFLQPRLSGEASQAKTTTAQRPGTFQPQMNLPAAAPGVEFDILANYNPLPEGESYPKSTSAKQGTTARPAAKGKAR